LSIVNGYAQILLREPDLSATVRFNIEEILKSGERAAMLTRQLLTFSRRQPIEVKIIDLNDVVSNINTMLRRVVKENISMTMVTGYDLWQIKADPGQIEQIIMNLVINARDAMPDGGTLTLETANVEINEANRLSHYSEFKPGFYVLLSVSDSGCGMDEKVRKHIFEPFFTTKEVGKGTGLGLATVYGILKQSNACVDVQSEPGKGTKFRIYFPRAVNESAVSEESPELAVIPRGTETILLAEDENIMRQMLRDFLQSIGYTVITACDGNEALELFEGHKGQIHLLLTDIVMPGTTGFELAKQMKKLAPEIKLLFMSGYAKPSDTLKMMNITDNLIDKPINLHKMAVKLREILDGKSVISNQCLGK
ncbi:MAG: ATP-binding protein, partial [Lentisphaerae bacterium]|nr:ATP-binding protein [Lentisphaerota bacterium]